MRRWPQIHSDDVPVGLYNPPEPGGSLLMAREGCLAVASAFERGGGKLRVGRAVPGESAGGALQSLRIEGSAELRADTYVFACGPWLPKVFPTLFANKLRVIRRDVFFVGPPAGDDRFSYPNLPTWGTMHEPWYGFPSVDGRGLKVCPTDEANRFDPDTDERLVNPYQTKRTHDYVALRFPSLKGQPITESRVCQVTNSVGGDFLIDRHPEFSNVWLAGAGSGHGFKHGPALGEYLASRILRSTANPELDSLFRLKTETF
jgi:glycine/D-amino acid oxidase-like deaminating enzyme